MKTKSILTGLAVRTLAITTTTQKLCFRHASLCFGFLAFVSVPFGPQPAQAAVTEAWVQHYGIQAASQDMAHKVVTDAAGNVIVAGSAAGQTGRSSDMVVIKYSGAGLPLWTNRYHRTASSYDSSGVSVAGPVAVAVDGGGHVFVTGTSADSGDNPDYLTIAYSGGGVPLWTNRYDGPANGYDLAAALAVDAGGNVFVTGTSAGSGGNDYATIAYSGAGVPLWTNRYDGPAHIHDNAVALGLDASGNVFVTGNSADSRWAPKLGGATDTDYTTVGYSGAGLPLWTNRYRGPVLSYDQVSALAVDNRGNVVVTGTVDSAGAADSNFNPDYGTIAYSGAGMPLWTNRYNRGVDIYDQSIAVAVDGSGNSFVTGFSYSRRGGNEYCVTIAYSSAGVPLWTRRAAGAISAVAVDGSGNLIVTGSSTIKYSGLGAPLWTNLYSGSATSVAVDGKGNVFVTGSSAASGGDTDFTTIAYSAAGAALWTNYYAGRGDAWDSVNAMAVDSSGNVMVTGTSGTIAYSVVGLPLWTNRNDVSATAMAVDAGGNVFVTGTSTGLAGFGGLDYETIAYSAGGLPLWTNLYNGAVNGDDIPTAVAVDGRGAVFVTGYSAGIQGYDYVTIAYSGGGAPLWTNRYDGPAHGDDRPAALAVDGRGNVVVTGDSPDADDNSDYYTAKYSGSDGSVLWQQRYDGPGRRHDIARAAAVDGSGNVVVTGSSDATNHYSGYYTAKYAAVNGALIWERRYNAFADRNASANAVAVDASGNVIVTGYADGPEFNRDSYTAKYAAADGTLLWEKHYNGPANLADSAIAVAVDASGNVVVTGHVDGLVGFGSFIERDYYTAKYAAADGATLWEKRFHRPWPASVGPPRLVLGPNGMLVVSGSSSGDYATIVYRELPEAISISRGPTGVRILFTGFTGPSYHIERAPTVTGPWSSLPPQTTPASGFFEYLDTHPPTAAAFYRASEP